MSYSFYEYVNFNGADLFTTACLPEKEGKFPVIIHRSPYVDFLIDVDENEIIERMKSEQKRWNDAGYAFVFQHCRGRGKSSGDCIPYINEREDGLNLHDWVRHQPFYNGELYLLGGSYTASVHFVTAPFADDIKGAILEIQDRSRYNCNYRNGFYKVGLHGEWYVNMYKPKSITRKNYTKESYNMLPLIDFSKTVFGETAEDFDGILLHPDRNDEFWNTRFGGGETKKALDGADIPLLFVTGFYDIFEGGIFDMWRELDDATKSKSALVVHPYSHGNDTGGQPIVFEGGTIYDEFGDYDVRWLDHVRGKCDSPVKKGVVSYYKLFGDEWCHDSFDQPKESMTFTLGESERTYTYDPADPASFKGGLSANFGGTAWQDEPGLRGDILTFYTPEFAEDVFVKGKMSAKLSVKSDCEDTCFYVRISLVKCEGDYGLRDDINQISNFVSDYIPGSETEMTFTFDDHAFVIKKGEKLRIDVSSSAYPLYVRHTNKKGLFSLQTETAVAKNTVVCDKSSLTLPVV